MLYECGGCHLDMEVFKVCVEFIESVALVSYHQEGENLFAVLV